MARMSVYLDKAKQPVLQTGAEPKVTFFVTERASNGYDFEIQFLLVKSGSLKKSERCGEGVDGHVLVMKSPHDIVGTWAASNEDVQEWLSQVHEYGGYNATYESDTEVVHNDWVDLDYNSRSAFETMIDHLDNV